MPRVQIGAGLGGASVNGVLFGPAIDARVSWRTGERITVGALFGFYGMNDERPLEGDVVPDGFRVISNRNPNVAQVRTWNGFVQWTSPSGTFVRAGSGIGWHRFAVYYPVPNTARPEKYMPTESTEGGLIFTFAAGREFRRGNRVGFALEGFLVFSTGEDSSGHRTIVGVNLVPLIRW